MIHWMIYVLGVPIGVAIGACCVYLGRLWDRRAQPRRPTRRGLILRPLPGRPTIWMTRLDPEMAERALLLDGRIIVEIVPPEGRIDPHVAVPYKREPRAASPAQPPEAERGGDPVDSDVPPHPSSAGRGGHLSAD